MAAKRTKSPTEINNRTANGGISNAISNLCKNFSSEHINAETNNISYEKNTNTTTTTTKTTTNSSQFCTTINPSNIVGDKTTINGKISNCDCTNIGIMHLFHKMKQEFPTIPDEIVYQHVNENCHQHDNCLKLLRTELSLNPSPVQAYPGKVLQQLHQQQQLPKKLPKPLHKSPIQSLISTTTTTTTTTTSTAITKSSTNTTTNTTEISGVVWPIMYSRLLKNELTEQLNNNKNIEHQQEISLPESPRLRPTTLNLFNNDNVTSQQKQFRNVQLQLKEQLQQRNQQQQQQQQSVKNIEKLQKEQIPISQKISKPVRRAPLPPLPPKPTHLQNILSPVHIQQNSNNKIIKTSSDDAADLCDMTTTTTTKTITPVTNTKSSIPSIKTKNNNIKSDLSPPRHRAVLHMNPHKSVLGTYKSNSTSTSPASPVNNVGQKSFTSVNLTLRQPIASTSPSTIDIVAGPGVSPGGGTGLTYSSYSYNAQHGYQKSFNITVSDEGSEISASRIRSPNTLKPSVAKIAADHPRFFNNQQNSSQENNNLKNQLPKSSNTYDNQEILAILELQKARRDKLDAALHENQNKLQQMEKKINILIEPVLPEVTIKLDHEIEQLRTACESMLNEIEFVRRLEKNQQEIISPEQQGARRSNSNTQRDNITPTTPSTGLSTISVYSHHMPYSPNDINHTDSTSEDDDNDYNVIGLEHHDGDEAILEAWDCNMCTFRNHPQLNICECCENVRILPGTIRIVNASASSSSTATTTNNTSKNATNDNNNNTNNNNNIDNTSNLTQLALHT